jgi:hypothetical protein
VEEMLKRNTMNRALRPRLINEYERQMSAGLWREDTGEAIKIASDGILLDGQQRLSALIKANVSLSFLIIKDLDKDVFRVLDSGLKRNPSDVLHIAGISYAALLAAGIRRYFYLVSGKKKLTDLSLMWTKISSSEILSIYNARNKFWDAAAKMTDEWYKKYQRILPTSEILALYAFFYDINNDDAFTFMDSLCNGDDLDTSNPIKHLREKLIFAKINKKFALRDQQRVALIYKTWNFFRKNKSIKQLNFNYDREEYPVAI